MRAASTGHISFARCGVRSVCMFIHMGEALDVGKYQNMHLQPCLQQPKYRAGTYGRPET